MYHASFSLFPIYYGSRGESTVHVVPLYVSPSVATKPDNPDCGFRVGAGNEFRRMVLVVFFRRAHIPPATSARVLTLLRLWWAGAILAIPLSL